MSADTASMLDLELPIVVELAERTLTMEEVVALAPGSIIEFPKAADEPLRIVVGNQPIGVGTAVKVGENYGVRVSELGDLARRLGTPGTAPTPEQTARGPK